MSSPTAAAELPGIVVALPLEARSLGVRACRVGDCLRLEHAWLALAGIGPDRAAAAAERLVGNGVQCLLSWGIAGGLTPVLRPGDLSLPERVIDARDQAEFVPDERVRERLIAALSPHMTVKRGSLWSAAEPVLSTESKRALATRTGVVAVDMESAAVAVVAAHARVPFIAIKAICDPVERNLPPVILTMMNSAGRMSARGLLSAILGGPRVWSALVLLRRDLAAARCTLSAAARLALPAILKP